MRKTYGGVMLSLLMAMSWSGLQAAENLDGDSLYTQYCAMCHTAPQDERTPPRDALSTYTANSIYRALTEGVMRAQGAPLTAEQQIALSEFLAGEPMREELAAAPTQRCDLPMPQFELSLPGNWNGWGNGLSNERHQSSRGTSITADNIDQLELVWAWGLENASVARAQPTIINQVMILGSPSGEVRAMDLETGCTYWIYDAPQEVRAAVTVAFSSVHDAYLAVVADASNHLHVLDARTGELKWESDVDSNPYARSTGSPVVYDDMIFVPVSSSEVGAAGRPDHHCCTFRGNVAAFDLHSGIKLWHTYVMEEAVHVGENSIGNPVYAPSGAPIWQAPSIDAERRIVYAGTGQNYTRPASNSSDSVIAFDMDSGEILWIHQTMEDDAFTMACAMGGEHPNCPDAGPDVDIGAPIVTTTLSNGQDIVVAGTKGAVVVGLDPDNNGELLWSTRIGRGGALGGVHWGMSFDGDVVYVPVSDRGTGADGASPSQPGLHAIDMKTGEVLWYTAAPQRCQEGVRGCMDAYSGPVSTTDDLVIASSLSGYLFAHDRLTGEIVWELNTVQDYAAINGVETRGGSIDATGPVLSGDYMVVSSGYATFSQMAGNAILVFRVNN
ncbi:PQQ-binding-like beta-propeller repeat protein [Pseudohongiella spirulinae]|uniref:Polyvinyl-alcohol dehydrogenase, PQQ-dependent n=1 Tax=Pseudohongiella spirulinae TaxID=1249552 RepID=A0A0S2KD44_9GAMM|nr:PQQ-binding-like beta-propeller repeat protein [Pseudohongiella spirulinae]ALO46004.1 Polyvinyl-alcohol dehydrogenase, PQQ-dependent [Pseudohongiella spirulinae]